MDKFFQILAVILIGVAAFFLWQGNGDGAFIAAVFGAVAFFLNIRFQTKIRVEEGNREILEEQNRLNDEKFHKLEEWKEPADVEIEEIRSDNFYKQ